MCKSFFICDDIVVDNIIMMKKLFLWTHCAKRRRLWVKTHVLENAFSMINENINSWRFWNVEFPFW